MLVMATHPDLVGTVHRFLATIDGPSWVDPTLALASDVRAWQPFKKRKIPRFLSNPRHILGVDDML